MNIEKKIGDFIICADTLPQSKGRTAGGSVPITENYDGSFDEIFSVNNIFVKDLNGKVVTPLISSLDVKNDGYVITWSQLFWIQGFAIINNKIYFIKPSDETEMYGTKGVSYWSLNDKHINEKITFEKFLKECILESTAPHFPEPENPFYDAGSNEHLMNDHMLF